MDGKSTALSGEFARTVSMSGDPKRIARIAQSCPDDAPLVNAAPINRQGAPCHMARIALKKV